MINSSGKPIVDLYEGSSALPVDKDVRPLTPNEVEQKSYNLFLRGDTLVFFGLDGNTNRFQGVTKGRFKVEVNFDDIVKHRTKLQAECENKYDTGAPDFFFRGPVKMSFGIKVGDTDAK